jgi:hypothetical protein
LAETVIKESTMKEYIEDYKDLSVSFAKLHLKETITFNADSSGVTNGIILGDSFTQKYRTDLEELVYSMTFDKTQTMRYRCNPWALSYDLYGSVEFWFLLLELNNMYSATEFTQTTINVYNQSLPRVIDNIIAAEEASIDDNTAEINGTYGITDYNNVDDEANIVEPD